LQRTAWGSQKRQEKNQWVAALQKLTAGCGAEMQASYVLQTRN
jgi:hypothetical protein